MWPGPPFLAPIARPLPSPDPLSISVNHVRPCASRQVFIDSTVPVVEHYEQQGKVARINADRAADDIYREVRRLFLEF